MYRYAQKRNNTIPVKVTLDISKGPIDILMKISRVI